MNTITKYNFPLNLKELYDATRPTNPGNSGGSFVNPNNLVRAAFKLLDARPAGIWQRDLLPPARNCTAPTKLRQAYTGLGYATCHLLYGQKGKPRPILTATDRLVSLGAAYNDFVADFVAELVDSTPDAVRHDAVLDLTRSYKLSQQEPPSYEKIKDDPLLLRHTNEERILLLSAEIGAHAETTVFRALGAYAFGRGEVYDFLQDHINRTAYGKAS